MDWGFLLGRGDVKLGISFLLRVFSFYCCLVVVCAVSVCDTYTLC